MSNSIAALTVDLNTKTNKDAVPKHRPVAQVSAASSPIISTIPSVSQQIESVHKTLHAIVSPTEKAQKGLSFSYNQKPSPSESLNTSPSSLSPRKITGSGSAGSAAVYMNPTSQSSQSIKTNTAQSTSSTESSPYVKVNALENSPQALSLQAGEDQHTDLPETEGFEIVPQSTDKSHTNVSSNKRRPSRSFTPSPILNDNNQPFQQADINAELIALRSEAERDKAENTRLRLNCKAFVEKIAKLEFELAKLRAVKDLSTSSDSPSLDPVRVENTSHSPINQLQIKLKAAEEVSTELQAKLKAAHDALGIEYARGRQAGYEEGFKKSLEQNYKSGYSDGHAAGQAAAADHFRKLQNSMQNM